MYDYSLTIFLELAYIWRRPVSAATIVFLFNRYLALGLVSWMASQNTPCNMATVVLGELLPNLLLVNQAGMYHIFKSETSVPDIYLFSLLQSSHVCDLEQETACGSGSSHTLFVLCRLSIRRSRQPPMLSVLSSAHSSWSSTNWRSSRPLVPSNLALLRRPFKVYGKF